MDKKKSNHKVSRKDFIKTTALGAGGLAMGWSAKSYANILGANDRIRFAVAGLNGRGQAHIAGISKTSNTEIKYLCDVDRKVLDERIGMAKQLTGDTAKGIADIRQLVEKSDFDALCIAAPEHWHVPMALLGLKNEKHIYVEKPLSHNPQEGEWMVQAEVKYPRLKIQMGNQQRSAETSIEAVKLIKEGIIGDAYYGKAFYAMRRGSIGNGKTATPPNDLDWKLWQGPAPHVQYRDNIVHYNWHWFWHWGIGEIGNNGLHEMDFCRWALGVSYPTKAVSSGGRYNFQDDDWEFYDTQIASYEYGNDKMISWEGLSTNNFKFYGRDRGAIIKGTKGTMIVDRAGYEVYDENRKLIQEKKETGDANLKVTSTQSSDTIGYDILTEKHFKNFAEAVRGKEELHSPMREGQKSTLLCHLGNISQKLGRSLEIDGKTGKIQNDSEASKLWYREYEPGWEPKI